jgi:hypothetical protein
MLSNGAGNVFSSLVLVGREVTFQADESTLHVLQGNIHAHQVSMALEKRHLVAGCFSRQFSPGALVPC